MANDKANFNKSNKAWVRCNEQIRLPQVVVIHDGKNLGVMPTRQALDLAYSVDLDLVEVSPYDRPPVCRIADYGKFMYDKSKKEKNKAIQTKEKEVAFKYVIDDHDLMTKVNQIKSFLQKGFKVKCVVRFEKREKAHKDLGFGLLNKIVEILKDFAIVEKAPGFEGQNVTLRLDMRKDKIQKKTPNEQN